MTPSVPAGASSQAAACYVAPEAPTQALATAACATAKQTGLPLLSSRLAVPPGAFVLLVGSERLRLAGPRDQPGHPIGLEPIGPLGHRLRTVSTRQPLLRALGLAGRRPPRRIVDATAGLGRDALVLAAYGTPVDAIERHPALWALLSDTLHRWREAADPLLRSAAHRIRLFRGEAAEHLPALCDASNRPVAIYLDPMYPPTGKRRQPPKEMQFLRRLLGTAVEPAEALLRTALAAGPDRVVLKRPPRPTAPPMPPNHLIAGKLAAYAIYDPKQESPEA